MGRRSIEQRARLARRIAAFYRLMAFRHQRALARALAQPPHTQAICVEEDLSGWMEQRFNEQIAAIHARARQRVQGPSRRAAPPALLIQADARP